MAAGDRRVTQTAVRVLASMPSVERVSQVIVRVLGKRLLCVPHKCPEWVVEMLRGRHTLRYATLWEIEREDLTTYYFTDHIGALVYEGNLFVPAGGPAASAREHEAGDKEHTAEIRAAIVVGGAETDALEASLWDNAKVTERIVDWRYPWAGCIRHHRWYLRDVQFDGEVWTAQLGGISSRMQGPRGAIYARDCTREFGDAENEPSKIGCHFAVTATAETGTVATVIKAKRSFTVTDLTAAHGSDYFVNGKLTWIGGDNAGITSCVARAPEDPAGTYTVEVEMSLSEDIQVGDTFSIRQGCQKRFVEDCVPKNQTQDFAGQRFMPGADGLHINPMAGI